MPSGNIIVLKGSPIVKEAKAGEAGILPGHLLLRAGVDGVDVVRNGVTADAEAPRLFAVEADVIGNAADDVYPDNDQVKFVAPSSGDELMARVAAAQTWTANEALESAGGGQLQTATTGRIIAFAIEDITTPAADTLAAVEVA